MHAITTGCSERAGRGEPASGDEHTSSELGMSGFQAALVVRVLAKATLDMPQKEAGALLNDPKHCVVLASARTCGLLTDTQHSQ